MSVGSVLLEVGFSGVEGIYFVDYPRRSTSKLLPIQELRYEKRLAPASAAKASTTLATLHSPDA